jgi:glycine/sarcosine N-methyltransferase
MTRRPVGQDPYEDFADAYDRFFGEFGKHDAAEVDFFRRLLEGSSAAAVLDCACGTGRHLHLFSSLGCEVWGSDISEAMLRRARRNLAQAGTKLPVTRADFRNLPYPNERFDAVVCLTTSLPHLLDEDDILAALRGVRAALREGGVLVLSQGLTDKMMDERPRFIPELLTAELSRVFVIDYLDKTVRMHVLDIAPGEGTEGFRVHTFESLILLQDDYQRLLDLAGYADIECYDGYSQEPYDRRRSDQLVVVARRG